MCIYKCLNNRIQINHQIKSTLYSRKSIKKPRQISYTLNIIHLSFTDFNLKIKISSRVLILIFRLKSVNDTFIVYIILQSVCLDGILFLLSMHSFKIDLQYKQLHMEQAAYFKPVRSNLRPGKPLGHLAAETRQTAYKQEHDNRPFYSACRYLVYRICSDLYPITQVHLHL